MHLNHPQTSSVLLVYGKIVFHEASPWCPKGWGLLLYNILPSSRRSGLRAGITFVCHVSLTSFNMERFSSLSLSFLILMCWRYQSSTTSPHFEIEYSSLTS